MVMHGKPMPTYDAQQEIYRFGVLTKILWFDLTICAWAEFFADLSRPKSLICNGTDNPPLLLIPHFTSLTQGKLYE